jgi:hypothetical protein
MKKYVTKEMFQRWTNGLMDSNETVVMTWFNLEDRLFEDCWEYLRKQWSEEEVAEAFWF